MKTIRIACDTKDKLPLDQLTPFQGKLKNLTKANYQKLKNEILTTGFAFPIYVWKFAKKANYILGGHQRVSCLLKMREEGYIIPDLPVVYIEAASIAEAKRRVLQDVSQYGDVDKKGLQEFMIESEISMDVLSASFQIPDKEMDMKAFRNEFFSDANDAQKNKEEEIPSVPKKARTKFGDVYQLGDHRLVCGDSTKPEHIAILMAGEKADMVWTDPPYNVAYEGKTKEALTIDNDSMDDSAFFSFLSLVYKNMLTVTKPGGPIYVAHADSEGANFRSAMKSTGWLLKQCLIWVKQQMVMGRQDYHWKHEPILYGWAPGAAHIWNTDRKQTTVLNFDRPRQNLEHPTMKPVELVEYCINNSSKDGAIVLDVFGGSGTTMIACEKIGRKGRLMELDPRYCDVIVNRWQEYSGKKSVLITAKKVLKK
jgi:DNA modification methylase